MKSLEYINQNTGEIYWNTIFSSLKKYTDCEFESDEKINSYIESTNKLVKDIYDDIDIKDKFHLVMAAVFHNICQCINKIGIFKSVTNAKVARLLLWDDDLMFRELVCFIISKYKANTIKNLKKAVDITYNYNIQHC